MTWQPNKLSPETRRALFDNGWQLFTLYQPPRLFPQDGRRLTQSPLPADPWYCTLHNGASFLTATRQVSAQGATADESALNALREAEIGLLTAISRLGHEIDLLIGAMRR